jgi:hypothetical protein
VFGSPFFVDLAAYFGTTLASSPLRHTHRLLPQNAAARCGSAALGGRAAVSFESWLDLFAGSLPKVGNLRQAYSWIPPASPVLRVTSGQVLQPFDWAQGEFFSTSGR